MLNVEGITDTVSYWRVFTVQVLRRRILPIIQIMLTFLVAFLTLITSTIVQTTSDFEIIIRYVFQF